MTEVQNTTDRRAKRMCRIARILAVIWVGYSTFSLVLVVLEHEVARFSLMDWLTTATLASTPWLAVAIAWRWERIGAMVLLFASWLLPRGLIWWSSGLLPRIPPTSLYLLYDRALVLSPIVLPLAGLLASIVLLASSWSSRTRDLRDWIKKDPLLVVVVVVVIGVAFGLLL
jgi:hypothetical protein